MSGDGSATEPESGRHPATGRGGAAGARERLGARYAATMRSLADRLALGQVTVQVLLGIVFLGLIVRLLWLGTRGAHYDEGRVAYWTLRSLETGHFEYRSIIHGPLVQHVDRWLFAVLGPSDFVARLPVALVGAALPLVALWFRDHLADIELLAMAGVLALNPILLYYSRFLRSDLLVATFMLAGLGALLRLWATRRPRYGYATAAFLALGVASKENAVVYVLCWFGAAVLVYEPFLSRPVGHSTGLDLLGERAKGARSRLTAHDRSDARRWAGHLAGSCALFLLLTFVLFAPRAGTAGGLGLWRVLSDPTQFPAVVRTTALDVAYGYGSWFVGAGDAGCAKETLPEGYACYLWRMTRTVAQFGTATAVLAVVGFLHERYAVERSRRLVTFATFWGVASFVGYPLGTDIWAAWIVTHVLVPLSIPAAVGVSVLVRVAGEGIAADREMLVAVPVAILLLLGGWTGYVAVDAAYVDDSTREHTADMVQYAQPERDVTQAVSAMTVAVRDHRGEPDVLYYGQRFAIEDESVADQPPVPEGSDEWFSRLPFPWYTEAMGADIVSTATESELDRRIDSRPPVVIASARDASSVASRLDGYLTFRFDTRAHTDGPAEQTSVVVFVDETRLESRDSVNEASVATDRAIRWKRIAGPDGDM